MKVEIEVSGQAMTIVNGGQWGLAAPNIKPRFF